MILKRLFQRKPKRAEALYAAIVAAARRPEPYANWAVPDTVQGRFDMIVLFLFMTLDRLKGQADDLAQELVDLFFDDMDRSLREMGVADIGVGKKVRKMAEACYGRLEAYRKAENDVAMTDAINRNLFPDGNGEGGSERLAAYVKSERQRLAGVALDELIVGQPGFAEYAQ